VRQLVINKRKKQSAANTKALISASYPDSVISEQFRMIQTNIKFSLAGEKSKIILITSPSDGEGKSTTAANLAITLSQQKEKVLLIDANLRNPALHSFFNHSNVNGLVDVLSGRIPFHDAITHTEIGRLDLLPSGQIPDNPVELLGSQKMQELLSVALRSYNTILIDSKSILDVTDTKLLAKQCDGVVLVIQYGKTKFEKAAEAKKVLQFAKAKLVGVVMNQ
jgi:capsular exopolysaccharide synthesis family protein